MAGKAPLYKKSVDDFLADLIHLLCLVAGHMCFSVSVSLEIYWVQPWKVAHATFYGDVTASDTMGMFITLYEFFSVRNLPLLYYLPML